MPPFMDHGIMFSFMCEPLLTQSTQLLRKMILEMKLICVLCVVKKQTTTLCGEHKKIFVLHVLTDTIVRRNLFMKRNKYHIVVQCKLADLVLCALLTAPPPPLHLLVGTCTPHLCSHMRFAWP